jgi:hypothetical protein
MSISIMAGIYSESNRVIFVHIPKTAGTTISDFLRRIYFRRPAKYYSDHKTISEFRDQIPNRMFDKCFKFTCVRNPFSMLVSHYEMARGRPDHDHNKWRGTFDEFVCHNHPSYLDYMEVNGVNVMDFVVKMENLENDLSEAINRITEHVSSFMMLLKSGPAITVDGNVKYINVGPKVNFVDYYENGKTVDMVRKKFSRELEMFNYDLET